ncbi:peptidyl-tRNA hydrolase [Nakamurella leprariae]|uniref:peptidyl-tRNA hydrolase n=1 Tax=Nakamurella leprariae TaxID=2803911 RepID=A0A939C1I9_9ACTN|nr:peptidyl-tRNA hydrolase [Nakamurella leprariae]MBM9467202.1 hypothetical protein [Nakamurella leprariae]
MTADPAPDRVAAADAAADPGDGRIGVALAPLRDRYAHWMGMRPEEVLADRDEAVEAVRAMQLVLRMERVAPPDWSAALVAAASGAARVCLDPRAEPGGPWFEAVSDYCSGSIRKVTRRARAGHWDATGELPGVTLAEDLPVAAGSAGGIGDRVRAEVRVLVPGPVEQLDPGVSRLQVGGTDVPEGPVPDATGIDPAHCLQVWLPVEPRMTLGKLMAQVGHAGMIAAALLAADAQDGGDPDALRRWRDAGCPVLLHGRTPHWDALLAGTGDAAAAWRDGRRLAVRDAGFTEIDPGTITVLARAPR